MKSENSTFIIFCNRSAASGASSEEDCRQLCLFLLRVPLLLAIPSECGAPNEGHEKQKMTAQVRIHRLMTSESLEISTILLTNHCAAFFPMLQNKNRVCETWPTIVFA